jgi:predicted RNA-binding Zn-ribbon protein involved in translation (DUF1610 family)
MILDEKEYAEGLLKTGFTDLVRFSDLIILAKYFRYQGNRPSKIKKEIISFWQRFASYNEVLFGEKIDDAIKVSKKNDLKIFQPIYITKSEMEKIRSLNNYRYEKICFIMLIIARNKRLARQINAPRYFVSMNFSGILKLAKVYATKQERNEIKHNLFKAGMILVPEVNRISKKRAVENFELLYADDNSEHIVLIDDFEDVLLFYKPLCLDCGKEIEETYRKHKQLCDKCGKVVIREQTQKRVNKFRNKNDVTQ